MVAPFRTFLQKYYNTQKHLAAIMVSQHLHKRGFFFSFEKNYVMIRKKDKGE